MNPFWSCNHGSGYFLEDTILSTLIFHLEFTIWKSTWHCKDSIFDTDRDHSSDLNQTQVWIWSTYQIDVLWQTSLNTVWTVGFYNTAVCAFGVYVFVQHVCQRRLQYLEYQILVDCIDFGTNIYALMWARSCCQVCLVCPLTLPFPSAESLLWAVIIVWSITLCVCLLSCLPVSYHTWRALAWRWMNNQNKYIIIFLSILW